MIASYHLPLRGAGGDGEELGDDVGVGDGDGEGKELCEDDICNSLKFQNNNAKMARVYQNGSR